MLDVSQFRVGTLGSRHFKVSDFIALAEVRLLNIDMRLFFFFWQNFIDRTSTQQLNLNIWILYKMNILTKWFFPILLFNTMYVEPKS